MKKVEQNLNISYQCKQYNADSVEQNESRSLQLLRLLYGALLGQKQNESTEGLKIRWKEDLYCSTIINKLFESWKTAKLQYFPVTMRYPLQYTALKLSILHF